MKSEKWEKETSLTLIVEGEWRHHHRGGDHDHEVQTQLPYPTQHSVEHAWDDNGRDNNGGW